LIDWLVLLWEYLSAGVGLTMLLLISTTNQLLQPMADRAHKAGAGFAQSMQDGRAGLIE